MKTKIYAHCNSSEIKYCGTGKVNEDRFPLVRLTERPDYAITIQKGRSTISGVFSAPIGFEMDGGSIPNPAHFYYQPLHPKILPAATAHDYLYTTRMFRDRAICDEIFFQLLLQSGVSLRDARIMWAAVRIGGSKAWNTIEPCILEDRALQPAATNPWTGGYTTFNEYLDYTDYREIIVQ
jgi:hypothetical protein